MRLNKSMVTAGILVVAGFWAGFALSNGSGQILGMKPVHKAQSKAGHADEVAAAGIMNAAEGDGPGDNNGSHARINQSGGGGGGDAAAAAGGGGGGGGGAGDGGGGGQDMASGGAGAGGAGSAGGGSAMASGSAGGTFAAAAGGAAEAAVKTPAEPPKPVILTGADAGALLRGNTVDVSPPGQPPHLTYYATRGVKADGTADSFVVRPWDAKAGKSCAPGPDGALVCRALQIRKAPGEHAPGEIIGTIAMEANRWAPIYKGNLLDVPDHIPFVDSDVADEDLAPLSRKALARGQPAMDVLIGHAAALRKPDGTAEAPQPILFYLPEGIRLTLRRPADGADPSDGIAVKVGHWGYAKGALCQGEGASGPTLGCAKPELTGKTTVRLAPVGKTPEQYLDILVETPKSHLEAAN